MEENNEKENESKEHRNENEVSARYAKYDGIRFPFLTRAREAALLTIPTLVPPANQSASTKYTTPYQGLGARGTNNLASKLLLALLPPNSPFFKLSIDDFELEKLTQAKGMRSQIEEAFGKIERAVMNRVETTAIRVKVFEALKHLIVAGNVLCHITDTGAMRVYPLSRYVVKRDSIGNILEIITKEDVSPLALSPAIREACGIHPDDDNFDDNLSLFTRVYREEDGKRYAIYQELNGKPVPDSDGFYPIDECPWLALRFIGVENEDYGRGFIEEYFGDLKSLEGLSKAILEASAAASKIVFLLKPNASISKKRLVEANNGAVIEGNVGDVSVLQLEKYADLRIAYEQSQELTKRLSFCFMLNSSVQRNGERVTAEEIRYMAGELEESLGGIYSILSQEFQLPLVRVLMRQMAKTGKLPELPKDLVKPTVTTGMEALGRGQDLNKLNMFLQNLGPLGQTTLQQYMNIDDYIKRVGTSLGIDMDGLIKSKEQIAQEQQQAQMMAMGQQVAPDVVKGVMQHSLQNQSAQAESPQGN